MKQINQSAVKKDAIITESGSKIVAATVVANEELVIVREAAKFLEK